MVGRANFGKWRKEKMKVCLVVIGIIRVSLVRRYYVLYYIVNRKRVNRTDWRGYEKRRCEKKKKNKVEA